MSPRRQTINVKHNYDKSFEAVNRGKKADENQLNIDDSQKEFDSHHGS